MCERQIKIADIDFNQRVESGWKELKSFLNSKTYDVKINGKRYTGSLIKVLTDAHIIIPEVKYHLLVVFKIARALRNRKYNHNSYSHMKKWSDSRVIKYYAEKDDTYFIYDGEYYTIGKFASDYGVKVNSAQQYRSEYKYVEGGWIYKILHSDQKDKSSNRSFFIPDENGNLISVSIKEKLKYMGYDVDSVISNRISANISTMKDNRTDEEKLADAIEIVLNDKGRELDSYLEDAVFKILKGYFGKNNVRVHYNEDPRYPYKCDFYIVSEDLFIELNGHWTHGIKPYNKKDAECKRIQKEWAKKAKAHSSYNNAITTWTKKDVEKRSIALKNNLNYKEFFGTSIINDVIEFLSNYNN